MLSKLLLTVLTLGLASGAFAEEAKDAKKPEAPKTWKDNLILSYHGEFGFVRKNTGTNADGSIDSLGDLHDFTHFHNPTIGYKLTDSLTLSTSLEFRYADHKGRPKFANRFYRALLSLSKSNILTEKEYGFQMDAGVARRYFDRVAVPSTYGNNRAKVTFTKNFGKNNASLFLQYLENDPNFLGTAAAHGTSAANDATWRRGYEIIPTLNLQLTDKLSFTSTDDININTSWFDGHHNDVTVTHEFNFGVFTYKFNDIVSTYLQLKYNYANNNDDDTISEDYDYYVGASYSVTPKITLTAEMGSIFLKTHDGQSGFAKAASKPEFTLYVDASF